MRSKHFQDDEEDETLFQRHRWLLPVIVLVAGGGLYYFATNFKGGPSAPVRAPERFVFVDPPPPPPPPPTPPPPPPPKVEEEKPKEEMVEQAPVKPDEVEPEKPKPVDEPPPIGTNNVGSGPPDGFGLGANRGGVGGNGNGIGGNGKRGSKFGWYAGQVQGAIADAMRRDERVRSATFSVKARVWADASGRITRATLSGSSGDSTLDSLLTNQVLTGLQLKEPPPADMPMPIVMRLNIKPPGSVASAR